MRPHRGGAPSTAGQGEIPPAHDPKQATVQQTGAACPEWARRSCLQLRCPHLRQTRSDGTARTTLSCPHRPNSPNYISRATSPSHVFQPYFPSTSPELHSPNHGRTISRQNAEAEAAEQNPVPHFPPASSDPQPLPDSQCAIIHPAKGRRKPLRTDFKLRREGTSGTVQ